jgi:hypothetical protein
MSGRSWLLLCGLLAADTLHADPKEDLIKALMEQCKLPRDKALPLATQGRTVQFVLCISPSVDVGNGCRVSCQKEDDAKAE